MDIKNISSKEARKHQEYKRFKTEVKSEDEEYFYIKGYASTFGNVDYGNDIIEKGAFKNSLEVNPEVPVLFQHNMFNEPPLGKSILMKEDEKGLYIEARFPKDDTFVNGRIIPQMKNGSLKELSIGFFARDIDREKRNGQDVRIIKEIELFEFSIVTKAMNPQATIESFKSLDNIRDVEKYLKNKGFSGNEAKALISKIKNLKNNQREAEQLEEKNQRDAEQSVDLVNKINELTNLIKTK